MRSVQFSSYGGPEVLEVVETPEPHAGDGEIRVAVRASSLPPGEMMIRSGRRRQQVPTTFPHRTGHDAAGVVDEVGPGVEGVQVGDEVFGLAESAGFGANSDFVRLTTWALKPPAWNWAEATAAAGSSETSTRVLDRLGVGPGCTLLINGASGSVGTVAVQLARARGAKVIGTAGPANQDYVRSLGAAPTLYGDGLAGRIREIAPVGVDAVLDCAGGALPDLIAITGDPARVVTIADTSAPRHGVHLSHGAFPAQAAALGVPADPPARHGLTAAADLAAHGHMRVRIAAAFPLEDVVAAATFMEETELTGKVILFH
ncbi:NADP-dependent oxidoreductase [Streptomyces pseudogriseolus]|uniref:NADP-dependent oxidoreductase n=1 Tax=Streptomyces pseudogriseolus TaxID=36817 RepID=UPI003FA31A9B